MLQCERYRVCDRPNQREFSRARNRPVGHEQRQPFKEERRENQRHEHAVHCENPVVVEPRRSGKRARAREALKNAEDGAQGNGRGRRIDVRDDDPVFGAHLSVAEHSRTSILANMS